MKNEPRELRYKTGRCLKKMRGRQKRGNKEERTNHQLCGFSEADGVVGGLRARVQVRRPLFRDALSQEEHRESRLLQLQTEKDTAQFSD
jgi:hypothetical protein